MRRFLLVAAALAAPVAGAQACPSCYGAGDNTPVANGMTYAIGGMLMITGVMLALIILAAFLYRARARRIASGGYPEPTPNTILH